MLTRKDLRVVFGGKFRDNGSGDKLSLPLRAVQLLERVDHYRKILPDGRDGHLLNLVNDMADAVKALRLLEESAEPAAQKRAVEYRALIAELEIEIVAALQGS